MSLAVRQMPGIQPVPGCIGASQPSWFTLCSWLNIMEAGVEESSLGDPGGGR